MGLITIHGKRVVIYRFHATARFSNTRAAIVMAKSRDSSRGSKDSS